MRLSKIKLSGFKSFVEPTTLNISSNRTGIVGPNGCGKSNIIDALLWVMGESSAKHLRGEALVDVIFNGSDQRAPVGQAVVELVFDNTQRKLGGQYASYDAIAIKRQINRDSLSSYFLNGTRCRRRDITDIFLGTGLGPRSYALIEQGTISRLIEAKPEELRFFIEEAAGVSKYRERRRETKHRIATTQENIHRLNDINGEISKQLERLQKQAKAAEKFQVLKQQERLLKAEYLALGWQVLQAEADQKKAQIAKTENTVEAGMAALRSIESSIEREREALARANQHFSQVQSEYYGLSGTISQVEQSIKHTQEKEKGLREDRHKINEGLKQFKAQYVQDGQQLEEISTKLTSLEPKLHDSRLHNHQVDELLSAAEQAMQEWQTKWDACNQAQADFEQQYQLDRTRLEHIEADGIDIVARRRQLEDELGIIKDADLTSRIAQLLAQLDDENRALETLQKRSDTIGETVVECRSLVGASTQRLHEVQSERQLLKGQLVSLKALQDNHLEKNNQQLKIWLQENNMVDLVVLAEQIEIDELWVNALEMVAGHYLHALSVSGLDPIFDRLGDMPTNIGFVSELVQDKTPVKWPRLIDKIKKTTALPALLTNIYIADDINRALEMRCDLQPHESVVTADGFWLGQNWLFVQRSPSPDGMAIVRQNKIKALMLQLQDADARLDGLETDLDKDRGKLDNAERDQVDIQQQLQAKSMRISEVESELIARKAEAEQQVLRERKIVEELGSLNEQATHDQDDLHLTKQRLSNIAEEKDKLAEQHKELVGLRDKYRHALELARTNWQNSHAEGHDIALQFESLNSRRTFLEQAIERTDAHLSKLNVQDGEIETDLKACSALLQQYNNDLKRQLEEKAACENVFNQVRDRVQSIEKKLYEYEQSRSQSEQNLQDLRAQFEQARLAMNECGVRLETIAEQLKEKGYEVRELLDKRDTQKQQSDYQQALEKIANKIQRLGSINLAAIDECTQLAERKMYLDSQNRDLQESLETLENAIHKIDRETRVSFKETFDQLNINLKDLFSKLFGGGHAQLVLTGKDILETGVTIMAQPPGKRNSTIHLLSGGEKALTALALVFSIFTLNPAPFCILDEVDAPLDDMNTSRFNRLLTHMSKDVQFIFITHNKITMEIAQQLLGVTMREAGVSRLVSVDIDAAVELAQAG